MRDTLGIFLLLAFCLLTGLQALSRERHQVNEPVLTQLASESIAEKKAQPGDWPTWRGVQRDGIAPEPIAAPWPEDGPPKVWEQPTGEGYSSVAVADGRVITFFQDGPNETLAAFDRATGSPLWRFEAADYYQNTYGNGPRSTPTVDGDRVYAVSGKGKLYCVDAKSGAKVWTKDLAGEFKAPVPQWGISFSPLIDGDRLIVSPGGTEGSVVALDKKTGDVIWRSLSDEGGYSSPLIAEFGGRRQLVAFTASGLVGLDPADGKLLWRFPWQTAWKCNVTTPIVAGDYVFITSGYQRGCALVHIQKTPDGWSAERVYENTRMCSHFASPVRFGETIYGFNESTLVAMKWRTGEILWKARGFGKGSVLGVGDKLLILGESGVCALAEASPERYKEISRFEFSQERCWSVPVVAHGLLYLRDQKVLACFDVRR